MHRSLHELFGAPPPAETGRERLLAVAIRLFYERGIHAIGLDAIVEEAGVTKTTFYKHFAGKDELVLEAVRLRDEWERTAWTRAVEAIGGADPVAKLRAFFDVMEAWFTTPEFRGCVFVNTVAEFPNRNDPIHRVAAAHKQFNRDVCRDLAAEAGAADPEAFADQFTALLEGTIVLRHAHDRDDAVAVVRPALDSLFRAHGL
jgi:AcrR family transcriptional regulator